MLTRRLFLEAVAAPILSAPAIVQAHNIMRVVARKPRSVLIPVMGLDGRWDYREMTMRDFEGGGFLVPVELSAELNNACARLMLADFTRIARAAALHR
jgi:hypothetical protein